MDLELITAIAREVDIPVIASGGVGSTDHVVQTLRNPQVSAVAIARDLHADRATIDDYRKACRSAEIPTRASGRDTQHEFGYCCR